MSSFIQKELSALGTTISLTIHAGEESSSYLSEKVFAEITRIEDMYSRFIDGNQLHEINEHIGKWQTVSSELFALLEFGKELEEKSGGAFTLSVKNVLESWGYDKYYNLAVEKELDSIGGFQLKEESSEVCLSSSVEMGSIGKGYALDCVREKMQNSENFFINAGGDIYAQGNNNGKPWTCFLEHPADKTQVIGEVVLDRQFLASSSALKRKWRNRHHLVNAKTLKPANEMLATYVLSESGMKADGYSTMLFCMGFEKAKELVLKEYISAVLISSHQEVFVSPWFTGTLYS